MQFTLVSTVFNEAARLHQTINDLDQQSLKPSEIIITDAGSTDGTYDILLGWKDVSIIPITILKKPGCNVAEGRNLAIHAANYDLIASTDFGCRFHRDWLRSIMNPFVDTSIDVVGGSFAVEENEINTLAAKSSYLVFNGYNININEPWFVPSSRSIAYKRKVFMDIGGYCEWLTLAADDLVFGKEIKARGYKIVMVNLSYVYWGRHKTTRGYIREAGRYGLGDGEAKVHFRSLLIKSVALILRYCFFFQVILYAGLSLFIKIPQLLVLFFIMSLAGFRCYVSYFNTWTTYKSAKYNAKVFLYGIYILEATRLNYVLGYIKGFVYSTPSQKEQAMLLKQRLQ